MSFGWMRHFGFRSGIPIRRWRLSGLLFFARITVSAVLTNGISGSVHRRSDCKSKAKCSGAYPSFSSTTMYKLPPPLLQCVKQLSRRTFFFVQECFLATMPFFSWTARTASCVCLFYTLEKREGACALFVFEKTRICLPTSRWLGKPELFQGLSVIK